MDTTCIHYNACKHLFSIISPILFSTHVLYTTKTFTSTFTNTIVSVFAKVFVNKEGNEPLSRGNATMVRSSRHCNCVRKGFCKSARNCVRQGVRHGVRYIITYKYIHTYK